MTHRALVLGAGNAGRAHAEALKSMGIAVVGPISGTATVTDLAPLRDPAVDVVHVATANDLHPLLVREALLAGKHVVCEKPLAGDVDGAQNLVEWAERSGRQTTVCQNYRFLPLVAELVWRVATGELGPVHLARGSYLQDWLLLATDTDWRLDPARGGAARTASDIGVHWLDLVETVTGRQVEAVVSQLGYLHGRNTEDHAGVLLRLSGGMQGICTLSQAAAGHRNDIELSFDGETGSASWLSARRDELWIGGRGRAPEVVTRSQLRSPSGRALANGPHSLDEGRRNLLAAFYGVLDGRASPVALPTFTDGLRHVRFAEATMRSAKAGAWVDVTDMTSIGRSPSR